VHHFSENTIHLTTVQNTTVAHRTAGFVIYLKTFFSVY